MAMKSLFNEAQLNAITDEQKNEADAQIRLKQQQVKYDTRDFVIGWLADEYKTGNFVIPAYQREFIWNEHTRCRFIESVLLGLPIPMMFFADTRDGQLEIVDGAQRMQTLVGFVQNNLTLSGLTRLDKLNGFAYDNLPIAQRQKFRSRALRCVVLEEDTTPEARQEIFNRINTSGEKARPSEIRRGSYGGKFIQFLTTQARDPAFVQLCPLTKAQLKRRENEELVLRFFAYSDRYLNFEHAVKSFLDDYVIDNTIAFNAQRLDSEFRLMLASVAAHLPNGFAKSPNATTTPRVRFEAISVGVNLALRINSKAHPRSTEWLTSPEFSSLVTSDGSNSPNRLRGRVEFVRDRWLEGVR